MAYKNCSELQIQIVAGGAIHTTFAVVLISAIGVFMMLDVDMKYLSATSSEKGASGLAFELVYSVLPFRGASAIAFCA